MRPREEIRSEFVEIIPDQLEEGMLYISISHATALHKCLCGCGAEIVTPLSPTDWELSYNGQSVSLSPSIGNWSYPCQSHYWIRRNRVHWAKRFSARQIAAVREQDRRAKLGLATSGDAWTSTAPDEESLSSVRKLWRRLVR